MSATSGRPTILQVKAVKKPTSDDYLVRLRGFEACYEENRLVPHGPEDVDTAMCEYMDVLFLNGEDCHVGNKPVAAWKTGTRPIRGTGRADCLE